MKVLIKKGTLVGAKAPPRGPLDVLIQDGHVKEIAPDIVDSEAAVVDARGKLVVPGLVDVHVHFREPGQTHKEDIETGSRAAAAGGFTTVVAEPNTNPPIDTPGRVRRLLEIAREKSIINFYTKAAMTVGTMGAKLTDIAKLKEAGAKAVSDDGHPVPSRSLMEQALVKARECQILVSPHCEESPMHRGRDLARQAQEAQKPLWDCMPYGQPDAAPYTSEHIFIKRDVELAERVGARIHISHVSLAKSVEIISAAKKRGVRVTAEATPHHFLLAANAEKEIGPNAKVNPPLRSEEDVAAVRQGLADGTIDIIASDHAPHSPEEKRHCLWREAISAEEKKRLWDEAPFGVIGLETTLGLVLTHLVRPGILTLNQAIEKMTIAPARIFGLDVAGVEGLPPGATADVTIIDPDEEWKVDAREFYSKGRNCPFDGWPLQGRVVVTMVGGRIVARNGRIVAE